MSWVMGRGRGSWVWVNVACVQTSPLPQKKSGEEIFSKGAGTSVHRLGLMSWVKKKSSKKKIEIKELNSKSCTIHETKIFAYIPFLFPFPRSAKLFHGRRTPIFQVMKLYALPKTDSVEDDLQSTVPSVDRWWWKRLPCMYIKYVSKSTATNHWVVPDLPVADLDQYN